MSRSDFSDSHDEDLSEGDASPGKRPSDENEKEGRGWSRSVPVFIQIFYLFFFLSKINFTDAVLLFLLFLFCSRPGFASWKSFMIPTSNRYSSFPIPHSSLDPFGDLFSVGGRSHTDTQGLMIVSVSDGGLLLCPWVIH